MMQHSQNSVLGHKLEEAADQEIFAATNKQTNKNTHSYHIARTEILKDHYVPL